MVALIVPIQQHEFGIAISAADQPDLSSIPTFYQSGLGGFWVAELNGAIVGTIGLKDIGCERGALRKMFVAERVRGREVGVAARLLSALIEYARASGMRELFLGTTEAFLAAHRFYEKNGFVEIAQSMLPADFPVMGVDKKFYFLALG
ncbi:MAG: GNAT family N-acetyltransferase [Gluconacetobacter sp.]